MGITLGAGLGLAWGLGVVHTAVVLRNPPRRGATWALAKNAPEDPMQASAGRAKFETWRFAYGGGAGGERGGECEVWEIAGQRADGPVVIFSHGWGESKVTSLNRLWWLRRIGARVIMWDLAGHGDVPSRGDGRGAKRVAAGSQSSLGTREVDDLVALVKQVVREGERVVLAGFSLGAGVSIAAAADERLRGIVRMVVAEAPYGLPQTPAERVMRLRGVVRWRGSVLSAVWLAGVMGRVRGAMGGGWMKAGGSFDRAEHAKRLRCPLVVLHSEDDEVCPIADGRAIAHAAGAWATLHEVRGCSHAGFWDDQLRGEAAVKVIESVLAGADIRGAGAKG
ncbi:MAG: alpha/beta hydrolase [Phycisphaerales bacterium]|nr:alpha/beta hydrolase [Phycisphaerales bacterium]